MTSDRDFAEADSLWEFAADPDQPATTDLEQTVRRVQRATEGVVSEATVPRDAVWARVMATTAAPKPVTASRAATGVIASSGWARRQVGRWQSVVSFGLVLAFLASLLVIAHDRVVAPVLATATPTASDHAGMVPLGATPGVDGTCVAREVTWREPDVPPVRTPVPQYEAKQPAPVEIGEQALATYLGFAFCLNADPFGNPDDRRALHSYLSGNMVPASDSDALMGNWTPSSGAPFSSGLTSGANLERLIDEAVIPVNRPVVTYTAVNETGVWSDHPSIEVFWAGDVYELIDGRYGVVIGSVSAETFRGGAPSDDPFHDGLLLWVSFVEQDGQLFIDEHIPFCVGEWVHVDDEGNPVATPDADATPDPGLRYVCQ